MVCSMSLCCARCRSIIAGLLLSGAVTSVFGQSNMQIYTDSLQNSWDNWSWGATMDFGSTAVVHSGTAAISVTITQAWGAFSLHHTDMDSSPYTNLTFWINGGPSGGQQLQLVGLLGDVSGGTAAGTTNLATLAANTWQQITVPLGALGVANQPNFTRFELGDLSGGAQPIFYLDDITLLTNGVPPLTNAAVAISVDAQINRHPISPLIYGVAFGSSNVLADGDSGSTGRGATPRRATTGKSTPTTIARDWYFESLDDYSRPTQAPRPGSADGSWPTARMAEPRP